LAVVEETEAPVLNSSDRFGSLSRRLKRFSSDDLFEFLSTFLGSVVLVVLAVTAVVLIRGSIDIFGRFGVGFLTGTDWTTTLGSESYGALPYVLGTLVTAGIAILLGVPVSLGIAVFLAEMVPGFLRAPLSQIIELLAAVPSVIYGFWGILVFRFYVSGYLETPLSTYLGWIPAFHGDAVGQDFLTAGLILAIMIIPTVSSVSKEVMMAVPSSQREAAYSIGATKWEVVRLGVLKYGRSGIFGATILGLGRAVGETMAVTMVIGGVTGPSALPTSLLKGGQTLSSLIATEFGEAGGLHLSALLGLGLVLFLFALVINVFAQLMVSRVFKVTGGTVE
jgi:phosphate transport system permease protein